MRDSGNAIATEVLADVKYGVVAEEYYDERRHPTCANFREASARILEAWLERLPGGQGLSCEVGAGASVLAELLVRSGQGLRDRIISDSSLSMLQHSKRWMAEGLRAVVCRAESLPLRNSSLSLLISSLGDPYNEPSFWQEVSRVLRPGGCSLFTTPSYQWARAFRSRHSQEEVMTAEFDLSDGRKVVFPSWIYSAQDQVRLIEAHALTVVEIVFVPRSALTAARISPKLLVGGARDLPVVSGYLIAKGEAVFQTPQRKGTPRCRDSTSRLLHCSTSSPCFSGGVAD